MIRYWMPFFICLLKLVQVARLPGYFKEFWFMNFDTLFPFDIYNICSDSDVKNPYFYGNYFGLTVIGNKRTVQTFEITPTDKSDCNNNKLFFIGIKIYERLCIYWEDKGFKLFCSIQKNGIKDEEISK